MCGLCSERVNEKQAAQEGALRRAHQLREMASIEERLADGRIQPHGEETKKASTLARVLIRYLVEDWM